MEKSLFLFLIAGFNVLLKILTGSNIFLIVFLCIVVYGIIYDKLENKIQYLLFFISWIYAIKFNFNQFSLYIIISIVYIINVLIDLYKYNIKINKKLLFSSCLLGIYILFVNLISNKQISITGILGFLLGYIVVVLAISVLFNKEKFIDYTLCYAIGVCTSGVIGVLRNFVPKINNYLIDMTRLNTVLVDGKVINRLAGLDLDPNYFASNLLIAISLLMLIGMYNKKSSIKVFSIIIVLSILGLMTISKMFLIIGMFIFIYIFITFCFNNPNRIGKYIFITILVCCIGFSFLAPFFNIYKSRLIGLNSVSELTTGRFNIWIEYIKVIFNDLKIFLLGTGIGVPLNGHVAHNMYLLSWYYIGLIGIFVFIYFIITLNICSQNKLVGKNIIINKLFLINKLPLLVILLLNMSLDSFFMDFFPYQIMLAILALNYYDNTNKF